MTSLARSSGSIFWLGLAFATLCPLRAADPLSEQECQEFGREFARLCRQNDGIALEGLKDSEALTAHALNGLQLDDAQTKKSREDYADLFQNVFPQTLQLGQRKIFYYSGILNYEHRQCVVIDDCTDGFDLCLVAVARATDGKPKWTDIYNLGDVTWESDLRRNRLLLHLPKEMLLRQSVEVLRPLRVAPIVKDIGEMIALAKRDGTPDKRDEALEKIEALPEKFRSQKAVLRTAVILYASVFNKEKFSAEVERWKKLYPEDLSANFLAYLGYRQQGDEEAAIRELRELKRKTGDNPYLQCLLSYRYYELGNLGDAKKAAIAAAAEEIHCDPIFNRWYILLKISAKEKDYQEMTRLLDTFTKTFPGVPTQEMVDTEPDFQGFRQSDEYRQWIAGTSKHN